MEEAKNNRLVDEVIGIFWNSRRAGLWCQLSLETSVAGNLTTHLSVQHSPGHRAKGIPRTGGPATSRVVRMSPSRTRRNFRRRQEFLSKKREACFNTENVNEIGENVNKIGENVNEIVENVNEIGENVNEDIGQDDSGRPIRDAIVQQDVVETDTDTAIMQLDGNISLTEIETEEKIEEEPKQKIRFWMVRNGIGQDEVHQGLIEYGIQASDFCIEGSFSRKDGDSEPVAIFDIEIRNYVRENKEKIMMMMRTWKKLFRITILK